MTQVTSKSENHISAGDLRARDLMSPDVLTISKDATVAELAAFLLREEISGAVVLDNDNDLAGVVSLSDIAEHVKTRAEITARGRSDYYVRGWQDDFERLDLLDFHIEDSDLRVRDIFNPQVYVVADDTRLSEVAEVMLKGRLHRVLVTRGRDLVGIISTSDFLKLFVPEGRGDQRRSSGDGVSEALTGVHAAAPS